MVVYLNLIDLWDVVDKPYAPNLDSEGREIHASKLLRAKNDNAVNVLLNSVHESIAAIFGSSTNAHEMWVSLLNRYEGNSLIKSSRQFELESRLDNFRIMDGECIEEMYTRFIQLLDKFNNIGEIVSNSRVIGRLLRALVGRPQFDNLISTLETTQRSHNNLTPEIIYTHYRCVEEKLKQFGELRYEPKSIALSASENKASPSKHRQNDNHQGRHRHSSDKANGIFDLDEDKQGAVLSKMFRAIMIFEGKFNKERLDNDERALCFVCQKEGHTIYTCFKLFPHLKKDKEDGGKKIGDGRYKSKKRHYKGKKKGERAMQATWDNASDSSSSSSSDSESECDFDNLALVAQVNDVKMPMDDDLDDLVKEVFNEYNRGNIYVHPLSKASVGEALTSSSITTPISTQIQEVKPKVAIEAPKVTNEVQLNSSLCSDSDSDSETSLCLNDDTNSQIDRLNDYLDESLKTIASQKGEISLLTAKVNDLETLYLVLDESSKVTKFDAKSLTGIFVGYSNTSKTYRVYLPTSRVVIESINVKFNENANEKTEEGNSIVDIQDRATTQEIEFQPKDELPPVILEEPLNRDDDNLIGGENHEENTIDTTQDETPHDETQPIPQPVHEPPEMLREVFSNPLSNVIGDLREGARTRSDLNQMIGYCAFVFQLEPKSFKEANVDSNRIVAMQEELNQFERNQVWELVPLPSGKQVIGTKWVYRNKLDEIGNVVRNKARLVAQGFKQQECIDFEKTFAPVVRLESIRMLLAYTANKDFTLFQMDVKSAFLNWWIDKEVYVQQPPDFVDHFNPDHVFKLHKTLYDLKQAPRAWYGRLCTFLLDNSFASGKMDTTLFTKKRDDHLLLVQIYVNDIIFGSTNATLAQEFSSLMSSEFEMSMMGELNFFLGLQIKQLQDGIFISQIKYAKELIKKFGVEDSKSLDTPMGNSANIDADEKGKPMDITLYRGIIGTLLYLTASRPDIMYAVCLCARYQANPKDSHHKAVKKILRYVKGTQSLGLWYGKQTELDLVGYTDADFAGDRMDRKSTSETCQFLGGSLVSWSSRKQISVALSTAEAEYVAAGSCCTQLLWMMQTLRDYELKFQNVPILCDNTSAILISKNPVLHSRTKHIEIRHHFIRDHVEKGDVELVHVDTKEQIADIFTKPLPTQQHVELRFKLGMLELKD
ncbi:hypothetical protein LUZ63_015966 [Rhynchospora breviuscula]|uniref:Uncharacterized protein n=1 Tax=Rhynchospora breviuscula TaxID=2022672 RepID=A0A9Q0HMK0_9POAL|nr:hypothetical protein LUZ63_015966 [Rhynchospora breviuscula]